MPANTHAHRPIARQESSQPSTGRQLATRVQNRLQRSGYPALQQLHCSFEDGELVVSGDVPSFYMKQVVYVLLRDVEGLKNYVDLLQVRT